MNFYMNEKKWICFSCAFEELKEDEVQDKSEEKSVHTNAPEPPPASESIFDHAIPTLSSREYREPIKGSIKGSIQGSAALHNQSSTKKKTCPACSKKMNWYPMENAWRCSYCDYETRL